MAKRFTKWEAERLLPQVRDWMREAVAMKTEYDEAEQALQAMAQRITLMGGVSIDRDVAANNKARREVSAQRLRALLENFEESGVLVKDLDSGLVDFPALFRGEEVYLCWKLDEPSIAFWHTTHEGFAGRKPIDQDFLDHHESQSE